MVMMGSVRFVVLAVVVGFVSVDCLLLNGGQLKADQDSEAWWDQQSHQWVIRLTCGSFSFQGSPPLNVTWTTPMGEALFSSGYDDGKFFLNLEAPIQGGNYSCAIPANHLPRVCEEGEGSPDKANVSAEVNVDELRARLKLAAANQESLQEMLSQLRDKHAQDMANAIELCGDVQIIINGQQEILENIQEYLEGEGGGESEESGEVDLSGPCAPDMYTELDDDWRFVDAEQEVYHCDKDLEHGWYRFYLNGSNAVVPTACVPDHHCGTHAPQWLDLEGQSMPALGQEVEARACAHWSGNCCNWESPISVRNCGPYLVYKLQPRQTCQLAYCAKPQG